MNYKCVLTIFNYLLVVLEDDTSGDNDRCGILVEDVLLVQKEAVDLEWMLSNILQHPKFLLWHSVWTWYNFFTYNPGTTLTLFRQTK